MICRNILSITIFLTMSMATAQEFICDHPSWNGFISDIRGIERASSCTASMDLAQCKEYLGLGVIGLIAAKGKSIASKVAKRIRDNDFRVCTVKMAPESQDSKFALLSIGMIGVAEASKCFPRQGFLLQFLKKSKDEVETILKETTESQARNLKLKTDELAVIEEGGKKELEAAEARIAQAKEKLRLAKVASMEERQKMGYQSLVHELTSSRGAAQAQERAFSQALHRVTGVRLNQTGGIHVDRMAAEIDAALISDSGKRELKAALERWLATEEASSRIERQVAIVQESDRYQQIAQRTQEAESELRQAEEARRKLIDAQKLKATTDPAKAKALQDEISQIKKLGEALDERSKAVTQLFTQIEQAGNLTQAEMASVHESLRSLLPEVTDHTNFGKTQNLRAFSEGLVADKVVAKSIVDFMARPNEAVIKASATSSRLSKFFTTLPPTRLVNLGTRVGSLIRYASLGLAAAALAPAAIAQEAVMYMGNGGCQTLASTTFPVSPETGCKADLSLHDPRVKSLTKLDDKDLCDRLKADPNIVGPISALHGKTFPPLRATCGPPFIMRSPSVNLFDGEIKWADGKIVISSGSSKSNQQSLTVNMSGDSEISYEFNVLNRNRARSGVGPTHTQTKTVWPAANLDYQQQYWMDKFNEIKPALIEASACCSTEGASPSPLDCENYGIKVNGSESAPQQRVIR